MQANTPHFLLVSGLIDKRSRSGWHFSLEPIGGGDVLEASHHEAGSPERLELLAVVRGLEALDQPSRVTLLTSSRSVTRGLRYGLSEWKNNGWNWERLGRQEPIKHADLWRRVDRALSFHKVRCRTWRVDQAHTPAASSPPTRPQKNRVVGWIGRSAAACASILQGVAARAAS